MFGRDSWGVIDRASFSSGWAQQSARLRNCSRRNCSRRVIHLIVQRKLNIYDYVDNGIPGTREEAWNLLDEETRKSCQARATRLTITKSRESRINFFEAALRSRLYDIAVHLAVRTSDAQVGASKMLLRFQARSLIRISSLVNCRR